MGDDLKSTVSEGPPVGPIDEVTTVGRRIPCGLAMPPDLVEGRREWLRTTAPRENQAKSHD